MSSTRVARVVQVLEFLAGQSEGRSLTDISRELGLAASSTHDLLKSMVDVKLLIPDSERRYALGPRAVRLGLHITESLDMDRVSRRHVIRLVDRIRQDVYIASRVGDQIVYVEGLSGPQPVVIGLRLGQPISLHSSAVGKLFLAHDEDLAAKTLAGALEQRTPHTITNAGELRRELALIRESGVSISKQENILGIVGIAAPVRGPGGRILLAVAVSALAADMPEERVPAVVEALLAATHDVEAELGGLTVERGA